MKSSILIVGFFLTLTLKSQCDFTNTIPAVVGANKVVCFTQDGTITNASTTNYGEIRIGDGVEVEFNGSVQNYGSGNFKLLGCGAKLTVTTFGGQWQKDDIERYCNSCSDLYINSGAPIDEGYFKTTGAVSYTNVKCQVALPVELIEFKAFEIREGRNSITWTTAMQLNNWYFEVEKSVDGVEWDVLAKVKGENGDKEITYFVNHLTTETQYYRLKQVDFDRTTTFSDIIVVVRPKLKKMLIKKVNFLGQEVGDDYKGMVILIYDDQTRKITKQ